MFKRNKGIDLLRIIAMLGIVILHLCGHGGINNMLIPNTLTYYCVWSLQILCYCAVNIFIIISGYVGYAVDMSYKHVIKLWMTVLFYSITFYLIEVVCSHNYTLAGVIHAFFPVVTYKYWFFTRYIILMLFTPMLKATIFYIEQNKIRNILLCQFLFFAIIPLFMQGNDYFGVGNGYGVLWFLFLYICGLYLAKYKKNIVIKNKVLVLSFIFTIITKIIIENLETNISGNIFIAYNSPTIFLSSIVIVYIFANISLNNFCSGFIGYIIPSVFSVYLISDNPFVREKIIAKIFTSDISKEPFFIVVFQILIYAILVFVICVIIDFIRLSIVKTFRNRIYRVIK